MPDHLRSCLCHRLHDQAHLSDLTSSGRLRIGLRFEARMRNCVQYCQHDERSSSLSMAHRLPRIVDVLRESELRRGDVEGRMEMRESRAPLAGNFNSGRASVRTDIAGVGADLVATWVAQSRTPGLCNPLNPPSDLAAPKNFFDSIRFRAPFISATAYIVASFPESLAHSFPA